MKQKIMIPIYRGYLHINISKNPVKSRRRKNKTFGEYNGGKAEAITSSNNNNYGVFLSNQIDYDTIFHEVFHLTTLILNDVGITLTRDSNEAFAYLQGWIGSEIMYCYNVLLNEDN